MSAYSGPIVRYEDTHRPTKIIVNTEQTKAARHDSISNLRSRGLQIRAADKSNAVIFRVAVGRHANAD